MTLKKAWLVLLGACLALWGGWARADNGEGNDCVDDARPRISFIQYTSPNIATRPVSTLTIKGKLSLPVAYVPHRRCYQVANHLPAVLILHGSSGVDARGDFYEHALNAAGFATLQIDMWEARGVTGPANRPQLPIFTYPDAFNALAFLSTQRNIDRKRIGVLGFSWGGVVSLASSERLYAAQFGNGLTFKAHVANYPICYGANNAALFAPFGITPAQAGTQIINLTGAPVLIQVGTLDGYDNGPAHCQALARAVDASNGPVMSVAVYEGAAHAWDRLMVPTSGPDPFGNEGSYLKTGVVPIVQLIPNVPLAFESRERVVQFFSRQL